MISQAALNDRIDKCEKILGENPNSQIFAALADAHRKKGRLDKALRICRQGLKFHPEYGAGHMIMARIDFDRKMYEEAEVELERSIELDGRTRSTDLLQVEIFIKQKKLIEAGIIVDELSRTDPNNQYYHSLKEKIKIGKVHEKQKLPII